MDLKKALILSTVIVFVIFLVVEQLASNHRDRANGVHDCPEATVTQQPPKEDISDILAQLPPCTGSPFAFSMSEGEMREFAQAIFDHTNEYREGLGLPLLRPSASLTVAATKHSELLIAEPDCNPPPGVTKFDPAHRCKDELSIDHRIFEAGYRGDCEGELRWHTRENVLFWKGLTTPPSTRVSFQAWLDSPGHHDAIVDKEVRALGVGLAFDGTGRLIITQNFGG